MKLTETIFGKLGEKKVKSYTVTNANGMEFTCIDYGCVITRINVPDRNGNIENVVLGFDTLQEYFDHSSYFGCVIGRNAGRMRNASFEIDGERYSLAKNDGENNLHGGPNGFHNVIWDSSFETKENEVNIIFSYTSHDMEEGFPGNLHVTVIYTFNEKNELLITYKAVSDKKTIVNLTNHSYFNLSGNLKRTILDHELTLKSDAYLELDASLLPTGKVIPVDETVFDFRGGQKAARGIESEHPQTVIVGGGFDHPFLLSAQNQRQISLYDRESGRKLEIETDEPAVVFYTGNMLGNDFSIKGKQADKHLGLCLETQKPPSHPNFPSLVVDKNEIYTSKTKYIFH